MGDLAGREGPPPAELHSARFGGTQPGLRSFDDQSPLELGQGRHHVEHQPAAGTCGVNGLIERDEARASLFDQAQHVDQVRQRPPQAVEPPDHKHDTGSEPGQRLVEPRPLGAGATGLVFEDGFTAGRREGAALQIELLVMGRDPCIADLYRHRGAWRRASVHAANLRQIYETRKAMISLARWVCLKNERFCDGVQLQVITTAPGNTNLMREAIQ